MLKTLAATLLVLAFGGRRRRAPVVGVGEMSSYFKAGGRCMVKPAPDIAAYAIDCETWERERAATEREFFGA